MTTELREEFERLLRNRSVIVLPLGFDLEVIGNLVNGLCANKEDHEPHEHDDPKLGLFWCTADQADREPFRSEQRRLRKQG